MFELLAPAGNAECFFAAINNGADAVYIGLSDFSARKNAENFTKENVRYYIAYAHVFNVKVYVAVNTLVKNAEFDKFVSTVKYAYEAGADAFIVQDVFLAENLKKIFPEIVLHLSTQGGVNNVEGAEYALRKGFSRVILARETQINEIKEIAKVTETEVFVHGALCSSFSGHCYISSFVGGNSGNRGLCKQPCRRAYTLETSENKGKYAISLSDLCLIDKLKELRDAGVKSVKIEGRMRNPEYVASVVKAYRQAIDDGIADTKEIKRTFNRGDFTLGYPFGVAKNIVSDKIQNHKGIKVGTVRKLSDNNRIIVETDETFNVGDGFKIIRNGYEVGNAVALSIGKILAYKGEIKIGDDVNITKDVGLATELLEKDKKAPVEILVSATEGDYLTAVCGDYAVRSDKILEKAKTKPITEEELSLNFSKTDKYPFMPTVKAIVTGEPFVLKSALNNLRATLYEKLFYGESKAKAVDGDFLEIPKFQNEISDRYNLLISDDFNDKKLGYTFIYFPDDYDVIAKKKHSAYLFVPSFLTEDDIVKIKELSEYFDGFYADGLSGVAIAESLSKPFIAGLGLNVFNKFDESALLAEGAKAIAVSKELSLQEISDFGADRVVFTNGNIMLAELLYCPYGRNCKNCNRKNINELTDELGHKFSVRRYKINGRCRFEIYNGTVLNVSTDIYGGKLINLVGLDADTKRLIINGKYDKIYYGNLKKGVL